MITILSGGVGSGKTLRAVEHIHKALNIYDLIYTNIEGIQPEFFWHDETDKIKKLDFYMDSDSMIELILDKGRADSCSKLFVIDETLFYFANSRKTLPEPFLQFLATSRHYGCDIYFICQNPAQIHYQIRHLVNEHIHLRRKFGTGLVSCFKTDSIIYELNDQFQMRQAIKGGDIQHDYYFMKKKYFDAYRSASLHVKQNILQSFSTVTKLKLAFLILAPAFILWQVDKFINKDFKNIASHQIVTATPVTDEAKKLRSVIEQVERNSDDTTHSRSSFFYWYHIFKGKNKDE